MTKPVFKIVCATFLVFMILVILFSTESPKATRNISIKKGQKKEYMFRGNYGTGLKASLPWWVFEINLNSVGVDPSRTIDPQNLPSCTGQVNGEPLAVAQFKEDLVVYHNLFYRAKPGIIMESGGFDPDELSTSKMFERCLNWKSIHIEPAPDAYEKFVRRRPDSLNINSALCDSPQDVHYVFTQDGMATSGIWEFMKPSFKEKWHKTINPQILPKIPCIPINSILDMYSISHIDLWILDVEGGELQVLKGTDLTRVQIDVLVIEFDGHDIDVEAEMFWLLTKKYRYKYYGTSKPNAIFTHQSFTPTPSPLHNQFKVETRDIWSSRVTDEIKKKYT